MAYTQAQLDAVGKVVDKTKASGFRTLTEAEKIAFLDEQAAIEAERVSIPEIKIGLAKEALQAVLDNIDTDLDPAVAKAIYHLQALTPAQIQTVKQAYADYVVATTPVQAL